MEVTRKLLAVLFAFTSVISLVPGVLGALQCEDLPAEVCAFAVSSSGSRCVLEMSMLTDGRGRYDCLSSGVTADKISGWIESQECVDACGVDTMAVGLSTDGLLESGFTQKLCSPQCYDGCPNIVNLYEDLAAGEGLYLPRVCQAQRSGSRRVIAEVLSSAKSFGFAAAPVSSEDVTAAPAASPSA